MAVIRDEGLLPDVYLAMGQTAENVATSRGVSRLRQDEWGVSSQNRAERAIADGFFAREILPVTLADGSVVSTDDGPRAGVTLEAVQGLNPVFRENGTITAGNASGINDGAAALVLMTAAEASKRGLTPLARIASSRSWTSPSRTTGAGSMPRTGGSSKVIVRSISGSSRSRRRRAGRRPPRHRPWGPTAARRRRFPPNRRRY